MNRFQFLSSASVIAILLAQGAAPPAFAAPEQAGVATAAVPSIRALLEGRDVRSIAVGNPIFRDERIETGPNGQLHVLLLDETSLTLGPNSEIVVNSFLYDPDTGTGELALEQVSGVMRLIGGQLTKSGDVSVRATNATIGIRGGIAVIVSDGAGGWRVFFVFGQSLSVAGDDGETVNTTQISTAITISADGAISEPEPYEPAELNEALNDLDSNPGEQQRVEVPDAVLTNLIDRLERQGGETDDGFDDQDGGGDPPGGEDAVTLEELEDLLGVDLLNEEQTREVFEDLSDQDEQEEVLT
ncbi:MAG: FecR domain-containing protein [Marivibrio sp.]|uniref:FecR family protein n=1 Tax=Marivibrio sp. TaxID=2039719 RepID=UPI0032EAB908